MPNDLTGERFGKLVVTEPTDQRKNGYMVWRCKCDCGGEILVDVRKLRRGTAISCGECDEVKGKTDLRGQRFGKLIVEKQVNRHDENGWWWLCKCDCGGTVEAPTHQLVYGFRKSCGCVSKPPVKDYIGKKFGYLTVVAHEGKRRGIHLWRCRCECGKEILVQQTNLQRGHTTSCGCKYKITDRIHFVDGTSVEALRAVDRISKSNKSGVRGVYWNKRQQRWVAQITFKGKTKHLGTYTTLEEAAKERKKAEERIFGEFLDWYDDTVKKQQKADVQK